MFLEFVLILAAAHRWDESVLVTLCIYSMTIKYFKNIIKKVDTG